MSYNGTKMVSLCYEAGLTYVGLDGSTYKSGPFLSGIKYEEPLPPTTWREVLRPRKRTFWVPSDCGCAREQ